MVLHDDADLDRISAANLPAPPPRLLTRSAVTDRPEACSSVGHTRPTARAVAGAGTFSQYVTLRHRTQREATMTTVARHPAVARSLVVDVPRSRFRSALLLCILFVSLLPTVVESASNATTHYRKGLAELKEGNYEAAVLEFERANALEPTNKRFLQKLTEAKEEAALSLVRQALASSRLLEQLRLFARAKDYAPEHPEVRLFASGVEAALAGVTAQIEAVDSELAAGSTQRAKALLKTYEGVDEWLPALRDLSVDVTLVDSRKNVIHYILLGRWQSALDLVSQVRDLLPSTEFGELTNSVWKELRPLLMAPPLQREELLQGTARWHA